MDSQHVPQIANLFPNMFPIPPHSLYPMEKPKGADYNIGIYFWSVQSFINIFGDEPIKIAHHKKEKLIWGSPQLINKSHTIILYDINHGYYGNERFELMIRVISILKF